MAMTQGSVVVGVFSQQVQAQHAVDELRRAGFSADEIGFLTRAGVDTTERDPGIGMATGAVDGGLVGSIVGAAVALLIPGFGPALAGGILIGILGGAAVGATAGGLLGAFTDIGVSDSDARFYQSELTAGRSIITVKLTDGLEDAAAILRQSGSIDVRTHFGAINVSPHPHLGAPPENSNPTNPSNTDVPPFV